VGTEHHGGLKLLIKGSVTALILVLAIWRPEILVNLYIPNLILQGISHRVAHDHVASYQTDGPTNEY